MTYPVEKRKVRVFTWIILALNVLMLAWIVFGISTNGQLNKDCPADEKSLCETAHGVGTAIGVGLIIALWVAMDVILGVIWLVTRRRQPQVIILQAGGYPPMQPVQPQPYAPVQQVSTVPSPAVTHSATVNAEPESARPGKGRRGKTLSTLRSEPIPPHRGSGPAGFDVFLPEPMNLTLTCGGTWGPTVLQVDGGVAISVSGAQQVSQTVFPTGRDVHFHVHTDGTWTVHLETAREPAPQH